MMSWHEGHFQQRNWRQDSQFQDIWERRKKELFQSIDFDANLCAIVINKKKQQDWTSTTKDKFSVFLIFWDYSTYNVFKDVKFSIDEIKGPLSEFNDKYLKKYLISIFKPSGKYLPPISLSIIHILEILHFSKWKRYLSTE